MHHVAPVLQYRREGLETGGQIDGTVRVTCTCDRGTGEPFVLAHLFAGGFMGPTSGDIPCDDRRHTVRPGVSRETDAPYSPPGRRGRPARRRAIDRGTTGSTR